MSLTFKPLKIETNSGPVSVSEDGTLVIAGSLSDNAGNASLEYQVSDDDGNVSIAPIFIRIKEVARPSNQPGQDSADQDAQAQEIVGTTAVQVPIGQPETRYYTVLPQDLTLSINRKESASVDLKEYVKVEGVEKKAITLLFEPRYKLTDAGKGEIVNKYSGIFLYFPNHKSVETEDFFIYTVSSGKGDSKTGRISIKILDEYDNTAPQDTQPSNEPREWETAVTSDSGGAFIPAPLQPPSVPNLSLTPWGIPPDSIVGNNSQTAGGAFIPNQVEPTASINIVDQPWWEIDDDWQESQNILEGEGVTSVTPPPQSATSDGADEEEVGNQAPINSTDLILCTPAKNTVRPYDVFKFKWIFLCMSNSNRSSDSVDDGYYKTPENIVNYLDLDKHSKDYPEHLIVTHYAGTYGIIIPSFFRTPFEKGEDRKNYCTYDPAIWIRGIGYNKVSEARSTKYWSGAIATKEYTSKCNSNNKPPTDIKLKYLYVIDLVEDTTVNFEKNQPFNQYNFKKLSTDEINFMKSNLQWDEIQPYFKNFIE